MEGDHPRHQRACAQISLRQFDAPFWLCYDSDRSGPSVPGIGGSCQWPSSLARFRTR